MKTKIFLLIILLGVSVIISGCNVGPERSNNYREKYYKGYDSLQLKFLDNSPPLIWYYDTESYDNEIPVIVEVKNMGASYAFGGLYIQGYDPNIIQVAGGMTPLQSGGTFSWNNGYLNIGGVYIGLSGHNTQIGFGWQAPNGQRYGGNVFLNGGNFVGLNVHIDLTSRMVGVRMADTVFGLMQNYPGWSAPIVLEGETEYNPAGGLEVYDFPAYVYYLPESLEETRQPVMVTACFGYATRASTMMCIDPNPNSNAKKACIVRDVTMSGGQGAPIAVTRIDQVASRGKVVFTVNIHHNRQNSLDDVFDLNSLWKCNPESGAIVKPTDKNVVYVGYISLSSYDNVINPNIISCSPQVIRLDTAGNGYITCTADLNAMVQTESAYMAPLEVELWYGYSKNIYKEIRIRKI